MTAHPSDKPEWIGGVRSALESLETAPGRVLEVRLSRSPTRGVGQTIAEAARRGGVKLRRVARDQLDALLPRINHQGVAIRRSPIAYLPLDQLLNSSHPPAEHHSDRPVLVVLDDLTDPHNLGAILRTAWAFGVGGVLVPRHRSAGLTQTVAKIASGAADHVPVCRVDNTRDALAELKTAGYWVYGATVDGHLWLDAIDWTGPVAAVFGSEGRGLRPSVAKACDGLFRIPMESAAGSLNVSVAAGVTLYRVYSQRRP